MSQNSAQYLKVKSINYFDISSPNSGLIQKRVNIVHYRHPTDIYNKTFITINECFDNNKTKTYLSFTLREFNWFIKNLMSTKQSATYTRGSAEFHYECDSNVDFLIYQKTPTKRSLFKLNYYEIKSLIGFSSSIIIAFRKMTKTKLKDKFK